MFKIVLPTDFSKNAWNAVVYALNLFKSKDCTFYLINTYSPMIHSLDYDLPSAAQLDIQNKVKESSEKGLESLLQRIQKEFKNAKHAFITISSFDLLTPKLEELVEKEAIDYIVMGTKGASGLKEVLFGTNTVNVLKKVKCPVLAIPENFEYEKPVELLFPTDYKLRFKSTHLQPIIAIAQMHHSNTNILNADFGYGLSSKQEANKQRLEVYFDKIPHLFHQVQNQGVAESIENFQIKNRIHLLAMINNKHSFFENLFFKSIINQIGYHLTLPFLVIPTYEVKDKRTLITNP